MAEIKVLSVSQLNGYVKSVFDDELILHNICVSGELSQLSVREKASYFTITEGGCYINCVIFSALENIEIGTYVHVYGKVSFFSKTGKVNFTASNVSVVGKGSLQDEFNKLKVRLQKEGLFDNRPLPPVYISRIAVITSEAGAVIHDIMSVLRNKDVHAELKLYPTAVQGDNAEGEIISAVDRANDDCPDVIIIARGGGSNYDLDVFNKEKLARAVASSNVPVISAIGHEVDYTLCDFCSGVRAGTPSIAAEIIADINNRFKMRLLSAAQRIDLGVERLYSKLFSSAYYKAISVIHAADNSLEHSRTKVAILQSRMSSALDRSVSEYERNLKYLCKQLETESDNVLAACDMRVKTAITAIEHASPLATLSRGFAKVTSEGRDVAGIDSLKVGKQIEIYFQDGRADAQITELKRIEA